MDLTKFRARAILPEVSSTLSSGSNSKKSVLVWYLIKPQEETI
jgi:hypothetical protein